MSRWDDQFEGHAIFLALARARQQYEFVDEQLVDVEQRESHSRLGRVFDHVEASLKAVDPELLPLTVLDQLDQHVSQITSYLEQFAAAPTQNLLDSANGQADALLALAPRGTPGEVQDLQGAVSSFRRSAGQHLRNLEAEIAAVVGRIRQLDSSLGAQKAEIDTQSTRTSGWSSS